MVVRLRTRSTDPLEVTVAVFGDPTKPFGEGVTWPDEWERPYADRLKIKRSVDEGTTLEALLVDVCRELGVRHLYSDWGEVERLPFASFYKDGDEESFQGPFESYLPLVGDDGRVTLENWDFANITFRDLVRSAGAKALHGDPLRPYLILHHPAGNGAIADWTTLVNLWDLAWHVMERLAAAGGAGAAMYAGKKLLDRARHRTRRSRDAVIAHKTQWQQQQGIHPGMLGEFLRAMPRTTEQIAGLLGCTESEAEAVCWAFGLSEDSETGQWKRSDTLEARLVGTNTELILYGYNDYVLEDEFERRLTQAVEEGSLPLLPWEEQRVADGEGEEKNVPPTES